MALENAMAFGVNEALKRAFPDKPKEGDLNAPPDLGKPFLMVCGWKRNNVVSIYNRNVKLTIFTTFCSFFVIRVQLRDAARRWCCYPVKLLKQRHKSLLVKMFPLRKS